MPRDKKKLLTANMLHNQKKSSIKRGHPKPEYTLVELREWVYAQSNFEELYNNWIESGCEKSLIPSIDRIDDSDHYHFDNIQLMTWNDNNLKGNKSPQNRNTKQCRCIDSGTIYVSLMDAERCTGAHHNNISKVCDGKRHHANGLKWEWV